MKKPKTVLRALVFCLLLIAGTCRIAAALEVAESAITTAVVERAPVDVVQNFPAQEGRLYCFTRIIGASLDVETAVTHVWLCEGREMSRVVLPVRSDNWRTWSAKTLSGARAGKWQVDVYDESGQLLASIPFELI
jgi:hypothetical protein